MATNPCPACGEPLAIDDINVKEGVGLCRGCGKLSRLADVVDQPDVDPDKLAAPPAGCSYNEGFGGETVVRASLRSVGSAVGALAVCLFWNGIVSVFVLIAIAGLYTNLVGPLPHWFPAPSGSDGDGDGDGSGPIPLGMALFLCVFLIPFVLIGTGMIGAFLVYLLGRIEVRVSGVHGRIRTGFGPLNWTRRFDPTRVKRVAGGLSTWATNDQRQPLIQLETADRTITFGSMLSERRREWLMAALHVLLVAPGKDGKRRLSLAAMARG